MLLRPLRQKLFPTNRLKPLNQYAASYQHRRPELDTDSEKSFEEHANADDYFDEFAVTKLDALNETFKSIQSRIPAHVRQRGNATLLDELCKKLAINLCMMEQLKQSIHTKCLRRPLYQCPYYSGSEESEYQAQLCYDEIFWRHFCRLIELRKQIAAAEKALDA